MGFVVSSLVDSFSSSLVLILLCTDSVPRTTCPQTLHFARVMDLSCISAKNGTESRPGRTKIQYMYEKVHSTEPCSGALVYTY